MPMPGAPAVGPAVHPGGRRARVLFVAEAVTLAHVARPVALAGGLDPDRYEVHLASDPRYDRLLGDLPYARHPLASVTPEAFLRALARGAPVYSAATLRGYVERDLELLHRLRPDVVIGDFRLSLSVSARLARIPYLTIASPYWSPYARVRYPAPDLPVTRLLGRRLGGALFALARPIAFALHTRPLNRVRRGYGLASLGLDLRRVYTDADGVLYADIPELHPTEGAPPTHHYLGALLWSPAVPLPSWWGYLPADRPRIYVTLGSSGRRDLLPRVLEALADLPVTVLAATAGWDLRGSEPANALLAEYLPGTEAAARARVVVCNGGGPTTQQALVAGVPVLGIPSNLDQHLNMAAVASAGAGLWISAREAKTGRLQALAAALIEDAGYGRAAERTAQAYARYDPAVRFRAVLETLLRPRS
jgi:UDP:flavonoid glycosyltransferase YjiC (YdhE family)